MAPLNLTFQKALGKLFIEWQQAMETSLNNGKATGKIRKDIDAQQVACFIAAGYSGIRNMGKIMGTDCYNTYLHGLKNYLSGLQ